MAVTMSSDKPRRQRRIRIEPSPCCPVHGVPMRVGCVEHGVRRWYCPRPECTQSKKQPASVRLYEDIDD